MNRSKPSVAFPLAFLVLGAGAFIAYQTSVGDPPAETPTSEKAADATPTTSRAGAQGATGDPRAAPTPPQRPGEANGAATDSPDAPPDPAAQVADAGATPDTGVTSAAPETTPREERANGKDPGKAALPQGEDSGRDEAPQGKMSREAIMETITDMTPAVKGCYETLLKEFPEADGKILLKFTIVNDEGVGRVDLEEVDDSSALYDKELNECMIEALRDLEFPAPEGGEVNVSYPFSFASKDAAP